MKSVGSRHPKQLGLGRMYSLSVCKKVTVHTRIFLSNKHPSMYLVNVDMFIFSSPNKNEIF